MKKGIAEYVLPADELILQKAKSLGYKERIVDETQLVDGKFPIVQLTDEEGELRWEEDFTFDEDDLEIIAREFILDEDGNKIPIMGQKDIKIDNPEKPDEFVMSRVPGLISDWLTTEVKKGIRADAKKGAAVLLDEAEGACTALDESVQAGITTSIIEE